MIQDCLYLIILYCTYMYYKYVYKTMNLRDCQKISIYQSIISLGMFLKFEIPKLYMNCFFLLKLKHPQLCTSISYTKFNPFPYTTILQQTTLNIFCQKILNLIELKIIEWITYDLKWKHCGKRRNCSFLAISSFVIMFLKSRQLQRRQKASIWGKWLNYLCLGR